MRKKTHSKMENSNRLICPECNGEGTVYGSYNAKTNGNFYLIFGACPICSGEGTIKNIPNE